MSSKVARTTVYNRKDPLKVVGESKSLVANRTTPSSNGASVNGASRLHVMVGTVPVQLPNIVVKAEKEDVVQVVPEMDVAMMLEDVKPDIQIVDLLAH